MTLKEQVLGILLEAGMITERDLARILATAKRLGVKGHTDPIALKKAVATRLSVNKGAVAKATTSPGIAAVRQHLKGTTGYKQTLAKQIKQSAARGLGHRLTSLQKRVMR